MIAVRHDRRTELRYASPAHHIGDAKVNKGWVYCPGNDITYL